MPDRTFATGVEDAAEDNTGRSKMTDMHVIGRAHDYKIHNPVENLRVSTDTADQLTDRVNQHHGAAHFSAANSDLPWREYTVIIPSLIFNLPPRKKH